MLEKYFDYKKHKTDFKTEVIAGVTTFLTMAYIMFLNPFILSGEFAGPEKGFFEFGAVYTATILQQPCLFYNGILWKNLANWFGARYGN